MKGKKEVFGCRRAVFDYILPVGFTEDKEPNRRNPTGKTSFALALSRSVHMPVDSRGPSFDTITSHVISVRRRRNIDRIFDLAKKIAPCILFIDEFDYIAKTRISDDNGTMKREH